MRLKRWGVAAAVAVAVCVGLMFVVDQLFKSAVSVSASPGERSVLMAEGGFLAGRRAAYLLCGPAGSARVVTKARLYMRDFMQSGARTAEGGIYISPWERRGQVPVAAKLSVTLTAKGWLDTLESDVLPRSAAAPVFDGLRNPANDFIAFHAFEHGIYFRRDGTSTDLRALDRCVAG